MHKNKYHKVKKNMRMHILYTISMFFYPSLIFSQILSVEEMHKDIEYYFTTLKNEHCDLYSKYSHLQFDSIQQKMLANINKEMSVLDFNRILLSLNQYTDGHTAIDRQNLYWRNPNFNNIMPFTIQNDSLFIDNKFVISINGKNINGLISEIRKSFSWEDNFKTVDEDIKRHMPYYLSSFYNIYPPYYIESIDILTNTSYTDTLNLKKIKTFDMPFGLEIYKEDSIAVFYYTTCQLEHVKNEFEKMLPKIFNHLIEQNIKYLFINITQNGGGNDKFNNLIFKYLNSTKYKGKSYSKINKSKIPIWWNQELEKLNSFKKYLATKIYAKRVKEALKTGILYNKVIFKENKSGFNGLVFLLQGSHTYSAAVNFSTHFKLRDMGIIVGEECGEPVDYSGSIMNHTLPHSKINFTCATKKNWYKPNVNTVNGFLQPDIKYNLENKRILTLNDYKKIIMLNKERNNCIYQSTD